MAGNALGISGGGTSQTTAPGARIALGLEIGVDVQAHDADLDAISALAGTGIAVRTAADTWTTRTTVAPAAGLTITNPAGIAGNITFALANDLAAIEALNTNAILVRTGTDTWAARTIQGTANQITLTNGSGVSGDPVIALANPLTTPGNATINGTLVVNTNANPDANDGAGLGTGTLGWSDLFLAAGGVINWNNGVITQTESSGSMTWSSTLAGIPLYTFTGTDGGTFGPFLQLFHDSVSPANNDIIFEINGLGRSSTGVQRTYSTFLTTILDTTNASEDAQMQWYNQQAGTLTQQMTLDSATGLNVIVGGVKFPATQIPFANANILDDYEEGTWTPTVTSLTGTITTVSANTANYTKIGNRVSGDITFTITTNGTGATNLLIAGLPFTAGAGAAVTGQDLTSGKTINGNIINGTTNIQQIFNYDVTYPGASGHVYIIYYSYKV